MRLLSVDWDFFFPTPEPDHPDRFHLFDWGHRESPFYLASSLWEGRAATFLANGRDLPGLSGEQVCFWSRFRFAKQARLFLSESHAAAARTEVARGVTEVWNYDAHHDLGYDRAGYERCGTGVFTCDTWALLYTEALAVPVTVVYPRWKRHAFDDEPKHQARGPGRVARVFDDPSGSPPAFDRVVVCRSGAWVPTWHDDAFSSFVEACPIAPARRRDVSPYPLTPRGYDAAMARRHADHLLAVHASNAALRGERGSPAP